METQIHTWRSSNSHEGLITSHLVPLASPKPFVSNIVCSRLVVGCCPLGVCQLPAGSLPVRGSSGEQIRKKWSLALGADPCRAAVQICWIRARDGRAGAISGAKPTALVARGPRQSIRRAARERALPGRWSSWYTPSRGSCCSTSRLQFLRGIDIVQLIAAVHLRHEIRQLQLLELDGSTARASSG